MAAARDPRIVLEHRADHCRPELRGLSRRPDPTRRPVERCIEIVSEASRRLPRDLKESHPAIPWSKIAGIGSVLRHDYDVVNNATVWHAATVDLAPLKDVIEGLLRGLGDREVP
jgi:uncharacterized protein with HEPN domain